MTPLTHIKRLRFCRTGDSTFASKASQLTANATIGFYSSQ
jgi:hypothetical protein